VDSLYDTLHRFVMRILAETIRDVTNAESEIVHVDPRESDIDHSQADITRAREQLGYEPVYSIEAGLRAYLG
jgi:UDP-glucose 4-epimerase